MGQAETAEKVKSIIVEQLGVPAEEVTDDASFIEDLGADSLDIVELINARIAETRRLASLPVGIGFGIRTPQSAAASAASADAIIVGSALVEIIEQHGKHIDAAASALEIFVRSLRDAIDGKAHAA